MRFDICIDIGGTFTDCLVESDGGEVAIFKVPTTPDAFHQGFIDALHAAAPAYGLTPEEFIASIDLIIHGSTVSTNALVERKVARTGLILNEGHKDILLLREGPRKGAFEWRIDYPDPYIPHARTRTVAGRINARGGEVSPLREADVIAAVAHFKAIGVEAIAVGLLWSIVNPAHERRVREIIGELWPEVAVTLSSEINPIAREYRRIIAAAIDASVSPIVRSYVQELESALKAAGFEGELVLANSVGGMMPTSEILRRPIYSVMSGPTLAPVAALALTDERDVVVGDMGGTTFDVSALRGRQLIVTTDSTIHDDFLGIPKVDVRSVGAGGGSIASVDVAGLLVVGPESAGAKPGPACYGLGGARPTVTDANVVLGIVDPDFFLGGKIKLNRRLADEAIGGLARQLGMSPMEAAYGVHTTSNHNMVTAIEEITIREGVDPRESYFVCGGGATACHVAEMADILGLKRYMVPRFVAGLSAFGGLVSDLRSEHSGVAHTTARDFDLARVNGVLGRLKADGEQFLDRSRVAEAKRGWEYSFMGRYEYQSWEIEVPFTTEQGVLTTADLPALVEAFHRMHERIYSIRVDTDVVEFTTWKVKAIGGRREGESWRRYRVADHAGPVVPKSSRKLYVHEERKAVDVPVFSAAALGAGAVVEGPSLVEADTFTALLKPKHQATVDAWGNFLVVVQ